MQHLRKVLLGVAVAFAGLVGTNHLLLHLGPPIAAAQDQATSLGWPGEDRVPVAGGWGGRLLARTAHVRFRSRSRPELGEVQVAVTKHSPFGGWFLQEVRVEGLRQPR